MIMIIWFNIESSRGEGWHYDDDEEELDEQ